MYELTKSPLYKFENLDSKGINDVPVGSLICILYPTPLQVTPFMVVKISGGTVPNNTLREWIALPLLWAVP